MFKVGVLASTRGTDLQAIIDEWKAGKMPGIDLSVVASNVEDCGALEKARTNGINAVFVDTSGKSREEYDQALIEALGDVDLVCLIGYMRILTPVFIRHFSGRIINVHPALLPKYGGKGFYGDKVHRAILESEEKESGMTIHYVDESLDMGPIFLQKTVPIEPGETVETLKAKVQALEKQWYPEAIRQIAQKKTGNKPYRIKHDRPNCIGCTACANISPQFWEMSDVDGLADLVSAKKNEDATMELDISEEDFQANMDAAESCPVNVIHLIKIDSGEQLI